MLSYQCLRLSLCGYPDEIDKRRPQFWLRPLIGLPPAAAIGSLASVALSSEQAKAILSNFFGSGRFFS
jgi:hypothetical protein